MKVFGISLFAREMKVMVKFYEKALGMKSNWAGRSFAEFIMGEDFHLMIYERNAMEALISRKPDYTNDINGTMEFALEFPKYSDVDKEYKRILNIAGAKPVLAPTSTPWGQRTCYIADPDGNLIEIVSTGQVE